MDIEEQYDKIYRYCYFKIYNKQLAEDITQETFLRFFRQNLNIDNSKELAYLYTIARNLCVDTFRKKTVESLDKIEEEATYDPSDKWADDFALKSIIAKLPKDEQELLLLRYANELPINSICKITGLSRFAIHRRLSKALKLLKEELKKGGFHE
ncbi:MAG: RNA polymerase sigma factor [Intestinibacter sp.]|uniref:RNA polymerase sigma factor n=1 Tax=Intestinibacter sp. TaxID=1965304 RepID=UPI002A8337D3|nr:RNA polymerase sigma factor [Intestinibacter sp.]MDY4575521.1 RNA polymerase sigma factor [Intestinibacter sp.]